MEEEEYNVIFEGSALHQHLASLNLLYTDDILPREKINTNQDGIKSNCDKIKTHYYVENIWIFIQLWCKSLIEWITQKEMYDQQLAYNIALLICSKNLLTLDDRLYLYHFSPMFTSLMDDPGMKLQTQSRVSHRLQAISIMAFILSSTLAVYNYNILAHVCSLPLFLLIIRWVIKKKNEKDFKRVEETVKLLSATEGSCLPQAISAATEINIISTSSSISSKDNTLKKVNSQCEKLLQQIGRAVKKTFLLLRECGQVIEQRDVNSWGEVKEVRRLLETCLSAFARDLMLQTENTPRHNSKVSVYNLINCMWSSIEPILHDLQFENSLVTRQINLMKQTWFAPHISDKIKSNSSEEHKTVNSLLLHLKKTLTFVETYEEKLNSMTEKQNNLEAYEELYEESKQIQSEIKLADEDCDVLNEIVNQNIMSIDNSRSKKQALEMPAQMNNDTEIVLKEIKPYIPQDEFLEGVPEPDEFNNQENLSNESWFEDMKKEEQKRKLMKAHNKRVLTEMQPILAQKKIEFEEREKIAKQRCCEATDLSSSDQICVNSYANNTPASTETITSTDTVASTETTVCKETTASTETPVSTETTTSTSLLQNSYETCSIFYHFQTDRTETQLSVFALIEYEHKVIISPLLRSSETDISKSFQENRSLSNELNITVYNSGDEINIETELFCDLVKSDKSSSDFDCIDQLLKLNERFHSVKLDFGVNYVESMRSKFMNNITKTENIFNIVNLPTDNYCVIYDRDLPFNVGNEDIRTLGDSDDMSVYESDNQNNVTEATEILNCRAHIFECESNESTSNETNADWTIGNKELTLQERLQQIYLSNVHENDNENSDVVSVQPMGGLHFCSELASEAVTRARISFVPINAEISLNGMGESETFGD